LLVRSTSDATIDAGLREAFHQIERGGRTAQAFEVWRDDYLDQVAVAWVLACVFVRFMEDNQLIDECWLDAGAVDPIEAEGRSLASRAGGANIGLSRRLCIMTIHLSKDQEKFVLEAVRAGLYESEDAVVGAALKGLEQIMSKPARTSGRKAKPTKSAPQKPKKPLTRAELDQYMLEIGLLSQLPDTDADFDDPHDEPIAIRGEPLSETVIRERR